MPPAKEVFKFLYWEGLRVVVREEPRPYPEQQGKTTKQKKEEEEGMGWNVGLILGEHG